MMFPLSTVPSFPLGPITDALPFLPGEFPLLVCQALASRKPSPPPEDQVGSSSSVLPNTLSLRLGRVSGTVRAHELRDGLTCPWLTSV